MVATKEEALERVKYIHETYQQPALVEEFIQGKEIQVFILGQIEPRVLATGDIDFSKMPKDEPNIISYQAKWDEKSPLYEATEPNFPAKLDEEVKMKIEKAALRAYKELGCRDYARVDLRLRADGKFYILEINANPDISLEGGLDKMAAVDGKTYNQVICEIAASAVSRASRKINREIATKSVIS